jgi:mRNA interferase RelE/StbE
MAWKIKFTPEADKDLTKLDKAVVQRLLKFLFERVAPSDNPRIIGEALQGKEFGKYWKYRVGDYRLICQIQDQTVTVLVVKIGHRREIYKQTP